MDYFNDAITTFLGLEKGWLCRLSMEGQKALRFYQKDRRRWTKVLWVCNDIWV